ncbi:hypothetical protein DM02DRAFT_681805 [Periconia macrospinosa]|uniref:Uncharacterized protein n=1 Tax=Periconia macrospinosa TaxID=97972 RepID=A0A2V1DKA4_9PLEO|nr:hypothetical protein DM02DRAFT_681805 [Periconia macrospinosa]
MNDPSEQHSVYQPSNFPCHFHHNLDANHQTQPPSHTFAYSMRGAIIEDHECAEPHGDYASSTPNEGSLETVENHRKCVDALRQSIAGLKEELFEVEKKNSDLHGQIHVVKETAKKMDALWDLLKDMRDQATLKTDAEQVTLTQYCKEMSKRQQPEEKGQDGI